ncbi:MAG TPA: hypothetical protein DC017_09885 [Candidatus Wallbacteria bacterium]|nr:hypothetical protein [Candidatus Wallbacteria bacterium]
MNPEAMKTPEKKSRGGSQASKPKKDSAPSGYFLVNFFSDGSWADRLNQLNPGFVKNIISRADAILAGEYELNGVYFKVGEQIDWHNDFNYSRWPAASGYKNMSADFYDALGAGPEKEEGIWPYGVQFAKNNEWVWLALACGITGADQYALKIADLFKSFAAGNEIGCGINFMSDAVCAERLVSWLMAFELIEEKYGALFNELGFHEYFNRQFDHIYERVVNRPQAANRHERIISLSCIYGVLLQVGGRIAPAVAKVYKKLKEEVSLQFNRDGGHVSASPAFQLAVYKSLLYALILSKKSRGAQSLFAPNSAFDDAEFTDAFGRMSRYLSALAKPDGELANIADYYSYFFLPFDEFSPVDLKPSLQMASYLLMDGGLKFLTGGSKISGIAMIFGQEAIESYNSLQVEISEAASMRFAESGYFTLTSPVNSFGRGNAATHFVFNTGGSSRVKDTLKNLEFLAHNDLHNMILSYGGANFIGDAGPALFVKNGDIGRYQKTLSAHNCVVINKTHFDRFCEYRLPESFRHFEDSRSCLVSSTHKAYVSAGIEALVRRTVLLINGDYMLVMDDVFNGRKKPSYLDIDVTFHSPPDITVESASTINNKEILIYNSRSSESKLLNLTYSLQKVTTAVHRASLSPFAGWHSDAAAQTNESASVIHSARFAKLPVRIYNLFYFVRPGESVQALLKKIKMNLNKVSASIDISHRDYKDSIKINEKFEVDFKRITVKI